MRRQVRAGRELEGPHVRRDRTLENGARRSLDPEVDGHGRGERRGRRREHDPDGEREPGETMKHEATPFHEGDTGFAVGAGLLASGPYRPAPSRTAVGRPVAPAPRRSCGWRPRSQWRGRARAAPPPPLPPPPTTGEGGWPGPGS